MMSDRLDDILKQALTPKEEPAERLNQRILCRVEEEKQTMKQNMEKNMRQGAWRANGGAEWHPGRRRFPAAVLAAVLALGFGSVSVMAAVKFFMPAEVTEMLGDQKLTEAFLGDGAVIVNETQSFGGYDVTFLGIVSGKNISDYGFYNDDDLQDDRSYMVVSIANSDGSPMPAVSSGEYSLTDFFVTPMIRGCDPAWYNAITFGGAAASEDVVDGVRYRVMECGNVEIFADRELYLGVTDSAFYNKVAYVYDEESGRIVRNESYDGLNALFRLPIDGSKADPEAAKAYLDSLQEELFPSEETSSGGESVGTESDILHDEEMKELLGEDYESYRTAQSLLSRIFLREIDIGMIIF